MNSKLDIYKSYTDQSDLGLKTTGKVYIIIQLKKSKVEPVVQFSAPLMLYMFRTPVKDVLFYACLCMSLCLYVCLCL